MNNQLLQLLAYFNDDYRIAAIVISYYYPNHNAENVYKCLLIGDEESLLFKECIAMLDNIMDKPQKELCRIVDFIALIVNAMHIRFWKNIFKNDIWYKSEFLQLEKEAWKIKYEPCMEFEE